MKLPRASGIAVILVWVASAAILMAATRYMTERRIEREESEFAKQQLETAEATHAQLKAILNERAEACRRELEEQKPAGTR